MPKRKAPPTAWKPGQSGNAEGASSRKPMADALRVALREEVSEKDETGKKVRRTKRMRQVAESLVRKAIEGDVAAIREVFDRTEGKVPNVNVEIPFKPAEDMSHEELISFIAGEHDEGATDTDSPLSRARPAGTA